MSKEFTSVIDTRVGNAYGHVPGNHFHDVCVDIGQRGKTYRVEIQEVSGSAQGYDEVHSRKTVVARGDDWQEALTRAKDLAREAGFEASYLAQAVSQADDEMADAVEA